MGGEEQKSKWVTEVGIKGEESRAGNGCCGAEQMATGGEVLSSVHVTLRTLGHTRTSAFVNPPPIFRNGERKAGCSTGSRCLRRPPSDLLG